MGGISESAEPARRVIRVAIVASSPVMRAGLEAVLVSDPALVVVGRYNHIGAVDNGDSPDVLLVSLRAEDGDPFDGEVTGGWNHITPTILLVEDGGGEVVGEALRVGARAVLPRDASGEEIIAAVYGVAAGLVVMRPFAVESSPLSIHTAVRPATAEDVPLTGREVEVLRLLAEGVGNKQIARRLCISEHTVKYHVGSIFSKLDVSSRTEAVTAGARRGLILL